MSAKLLFDQNLSPKLINRLADLYPNSDHLDLLGLGTADDALVWEHARRNGFLVITKDADFADLSVFAVFRRKLCGFAEVIAQQPTLKNCYATVTLRLKIW